MGGRDLFKVYRTEGFFSQRKKKINKAFTFSEKLFFYSTFPQFYLSEGGLLLA